MRNVIFLSLLSISMYAKVFVQDGEKDKIEEILASIIEADNNENISAIAKLYSKDAILMPPGAMPIVGIDQILEHYGKLFKNYDFQDLDFDTEETIVIDNWAINSGITKGEIIESISGTSITVNDKYVMTLLKMDGKWRIKRLIWNKNSYIAVNEN